MRKRVATKDFVDLGGQSPKIWFRTSFWPRLHLVRTSLKYVKIAAGQNQAPRGFGKALQWFVAWFAACVNSNQHVERMMWHSCFAYDIPPAFHPSPRRPYAVITRAAPFRRKS